MGDDTEETMKELGKNVLKAYNEQSPEEEFLLRLSKVVDVNKSILKGSGAIFAFVFGQTRVSIKSTSSWSQFTVFHLQVLLWMLRIRSSSSIVHASDCSQLPALQKQILWLVTAGGDGKLPLSGIQIRLEEEADKSLVFEIAEATPKEFVFDLMQTHDMFFDWEGGGLRPAVKTLLILLKKANNSNLSLNPNYRRSVDSQRHDLLFSEKLSDVTFVCPDGVALPAHQIVLSGESPYFDAFFTGPWSEQNEDRQWKTQIKSGVLKTVLTFIYTGSFGSVQYDKSVDTLVEILQVGQEFQMANLVEVCCKMIRPKLSSENIKKVTCVAAAVTPPFMGPTNLWKYCVKFVRDHSHDVLMDPNFAALATEHPDVWNQLRDQISPAQMRKRKRSTG